MAERIQSVFPVPEAWVVDDTSFPKKGEHSVGVQRQYCGALGKKANCQVAVSLHRADTSGSSPLGFRLYLPAVWTEDRPRCRQAGVPDEVVFQKKWELALALMDRALAWGVGKPEAVLADSGYGDNGAFRQGLEQRGLPYAVGITHEVVVWTEPPTSAVPSAPGPKPKGMRYGTYGPCRCARWPSRSASAFARSPGARGAKDLCARAGGRAVCRRLDIGNAAKHQESHSGL
jgi:SRSO17 transposase